MYVLWEQNFQENILHIWEDVTRAWKKLRSKFHNLYFLIQCRKSDCINEGDIFWQVAYEGKEILNNHVHTKCKKDRNTSAYHSVNRTLVVNEWNDKYFILIYQVIKA